MAPGGKFSLGGRHDGDLGPERWGPAGEVGRRPLGARGEVPKDVFHLLTPPKAGPDARHLLTPRCPARLCAGAARRRRAWVWGGSAPTASPPSLVSAGSSDSKSAFRSPPFLAPEPPVCSPRWPIRATVSQGITSRREFLPHHL